MAMLVVERTARVGASAVVVMGRRYNHWAAWGEQRAHRNAWKEGAASFSDEREKCVALMKKYGELRTTSHPRKRDALRAALLAEIAEGEWGAEGYHTCFRILRGRGHPDITVKLLRDMERKGIAPTLHLVNAMLTSCFERRIDEAAFDAVWRAAEAAGLYHGWRQYNIYTTLLLRQGRFPAAFHVYRTVRTRNRKLAPQAHSEATLQLILASPSLSFAKRIFDSLAPRARYLEGQKVATRADVYNALLTPRSTQTTRHAMWHGESGFADARDFQRKVEARRLVAEVLEHMRTDGVVPNTGTFMSVLNHYREQGDLSAVIDTLRTFGRLEFPTSEFVFAIAIRACAAVTAHPEDRAARLADLLYESAVNDGHDLDRYITMGMMLVYAKSGNVAKAEEMIRRMKGATVRTHAVDHLVAEAANTWVPPTPLACDQDDSLMPPACPFFEEWVGLAPADAKQTSPQPASAPAEDSFAEDDDDGLHSAAFEALVRNAAAQASRHAGHAI